MRVLFYKEVISETLFFHTYNMGHFWEEGKQIHWSILLTKFLHKVVHFIIFPNILKHKFIFFAILFIFDPICLNILRFGAKTMPQIKWKKTFVIYKMIKNLSFRDVLFESHRAVVKLKNLPAKLRQRDR